MSDLSSLPSVDQLLTSSIGQRLIDEYGRPLALEAIRKTLDNVRADYSPEAEIPSQQQILERSERILIGWCAPTLQSVINASGVILHTNLGRAPISQPAMEAAREIATGYSSLEYDLVKGKRGSRLVHAQALLSRLTGAEDALVVNNNAAAVLLTLTALARRRKVVIARSQLVEIGGGFRLPDVMVQSGAKLLEVGTTNCVHLGDYEAALDEKPVMFLRAHRSNFALVGFTSEPSLSEIAKLAQRVGIPMVDDLGSGSMLDTSQFGLGHEPMVQESIRDGADLVCFSGDKLLGGPQAGIIVGRGDLVAKLKKHPLARAIRADKLCLAALTATLIHYLKDEAEREIPVWRMISITADELRERAQMWRDKLEYGELIAGESTVGGGSLPGETLPTWLLALALPGPTRFSNDLRNARPPVITRTMEDRVLLDPRTVLSEQDQTLLDRVHEALIKNKK